MGKKIGRKIALFVAVVTTVQVAVFHHYNTLLTSPVPVATTSHITGQAEELHAAHELRSLRDRYPLVAVSSDGSSAAYVDEQNVVRVLDLATDKLLLTYQEVYPIQYLLWIRSDSLFLGVKEGPGTLVLKTVQVSSGSARVIHTFRGLGASAEFKQIAYSALTNDVYILIAAGTSSAVYHFDTNGNLSNVDLGGRIVKKILVTETGNDLFFEDYAEGTFNVLCLKDGVVRLVKRNAALIALNGSELYYGSLDKDGLVTAVYRMDNGTGVLVSTLPHPTLASQLSVTPSGDVKVSN